MMLDAKHLRSPFIFLASLGGLFSLWSPAVYSFDHFPTVSKTQHDHLSIAQSAPTGPVDSFDRPPSLEPLPEQDVLPPPSELLAPPSDRPLPEVENDSIEEIVVGRFEFVGNTVFSEEELRAVIPNTYLNRPISLIELYEVRSVITQLYVDAGYITSGAFIPPQTIESESVLIEIVEGQLGDIQINGTERLNESYVRDRIAIAANIPLNVNQLLDGLRLLQLDPRIDNLSAELTAAPQAGVSNLNVSVTEAYTLDTLVELDNGRSPSVGSFRQRIGLSELNLSGDGDVFELGYNRTDGSNGFDGRYQRFVNARNGTVSLSAGYTDSTVIEPPFNALDIESESSYLELTYRQPVIETTNRSVALGLTASRQESRSVFLEDELGEALAFPSLGADENGRARVTALRFFQEWTEQGDRQVFALRSQFSLGLDALDSSVNDGIPDSRFFAWRGQAQWVRLLDTDTLLLVRADTQLTPDSLLPLEQFGIGGQRSLRGYRQNILLTDNGIQGSAEVRIPVLRVPEVSGLLQVAPFVDIGTGWNNTLPNPATETLVGIGVGLLWQQDLLTARLDWGIPLVSVDSQDRTWQENGVYFSIQFSPF
jgi:hemolysin activation/secretion protein